MHPRALLRDVSWVAIAAGVATFFFGAEGHTLLAPLLANSNDFCLHQPPAVGCPYRYPGTHELLLTIWMLSPGAVTAIVAKRGPLLNGFLFGVLLSIVLTAHDAWRGLWWFKWDYLYGLEHLLAPIAVAMMGAVIGYGVSRLWRRGQGDSPAHT